MGQKLEVLEKFIWIPLLFLAQITRWTSSSLNFVKEAYRLRFLKSMLDIRYIEMCSREH
jgi:hypothetical protein